MLSNEKRVTFLISLFVCLLVIPVISSAAGTPPTITASLNSVLLGKPIEFSGTATGNSARLSLNCNSGQNIISDIANPVISGSKWSYIWTPEYPTVQAGTCVMIVSDSTGYYVSSGYFQVQYGAVTIVAAGSQSYYIGETIQFSGTDTAGSSVTISREGSTIAVVSVNSDNTWSYNYDTSNLNGITAGTYTFQATDANTPVYGTVSVILKQPLSQTTSPQTGSLQVIFPSGANVYVNGVFQQNVPIQLSPGTYTVRVSLAGYDDYYTTATVYAGQTTTVSATLNLNPTYTSSSSQSTSSTPQPTYPIAMHTTVIPTSGISKSFYFPSGLIILLILGMLVIASGWIAHSLITNYKK